MNIVYTFFLVVMVSTSLIGMNNPEFVDDSSDVACIICMTPSDEEVHDFCDTCRYSTCHDTCFMQWVFERLNKAFNTNVKREILAVRKNNLDLGTKIETWEDFCAKLSPTAVAVHKDIEGICLSCKAGINAACNQALNKSSQGICSWQVYDDHDEVPNADICFHKKDGHYFIKTNKPIITNKRYYFYMKNFIQVVLASCFWHAFVLKDVNTFEVEKFVHFNGIRIGVVYFIEFAADRLLLHYSAKKQKKMLRMLALVVMSIGIAQEWETLDYTFDQVADNKPWWLTLLLVSVFFESILHVCYCFDIDNSMTTTMNSYASSFFHEIQQFLLMEHGVDMVYNNMYDVGHVCIVFSMINLLEGLNTQERVNQ